MSEPESLHRSYRTQGGIAVHRSDREAAVGTAAQALVERLDRYPGVFMSSCFEFPGRYTRWDLGFAAPPLSLTCRGRDFEVAALEPRGRVLIEPIRAALEPLEAVAALAAEPGRLVGRIHRPAETVPEEQRSRQPSIFSLLRAVTALFGNDEDQHFGLYGAFGYDLAYQFEPIETRLARADDQRDLVLFVPDEILVVDHMSDRAVWHRYDFVTPAGDTRDMARAPQEDAYAPAPEGGPPPADDHPPGAYPAAVERARQAFLRGDLFEVVLSQQFSEACADAPSAVFDRLRTINPAPYCALMNLGAGEFLVAASPEMYVRVEGRRVETCPISGTIARGSDALGDAAQIAKLLNSAKDEAELTMCTDVDRNDKSRICEPGSVRVIGRRQVELYSRLIHTVDHVEGILRPEFDALDAFLSHTWAVTVTGAPKHWAIRFIEENERSARRWYGGAIGRIGFDGAMNTGLTLRTVRMKGGVAEIRAGATLLYDSDPEAEDEECRLKASALFAALRAEQAAAPVHAPSARPGEARAACSWSTTRIPSSIRWPTICARPGPRWRRSGLRSRAGCCGRRRPISSCSRPVRGGPRISAPPRPSLSRSRRSCRSSASASGFRPSPNISAAASTSSRNPSTASRPRSRCWAARFSGGCLGASGSAATTPSTHGARRCPTTFSASPPRPATASSWRWNIAPGRSPRCSSTRNRSSPSTTASA